MSINKSIIKNNILWYTATFLEWIIIPLYIANMGYEFNIAIYQALRNWEYVAITYYILSSIDIILFGYFVLLYKKQNQIKMLGVSVFCCLTQIILLISKVKL